MVAAETCQINSNTDKNISERRRNTEGNVMRTTDGTQENDKCRGGDTGKWGCKTRAEMGECSGGDAVQQVWQK